MSIFGDILLRVVKEIVCFDGKRYNMDGKLFPLLSVFMPAEQTGKEVLPERHNSGKNNSVFQTDNNITNVIIYYSNKIL